MPTDLSAAEISAAETARAGRQRRWDRTYMETAYRFARHSHDAITKVGALIVDNSNGSIISIGVNGRGKGRPNTRISDEPGQSGMAHGEMNAIGRASWQGGKTYTLYVTHSPCATCAAVVLNVDISRVVYGEPFRDQTGLDELRAGLGEANVTHLHLSAEQIAALSLDEAD